MNKTLAIFALSLATAAAANAQAVLGYSVVETATTYTPLDNPVVIFDGSTDAVSGTFSRAVLTPEGIKTSMGASAGYNLGFTADVAGTDYTDFIVSLAGYVYLGSGEISFNPMMGPNFMTYGSGFVNLGFADNVGCGYNADTRIGYATLGEGDDSRLVVEFDNYVVSDSKRTDLVIDAQVILYRNGKTEIVFDGLGNLQEEAFFKCYAGVRRDADYVSAKGESGSIIASRNDRGEASFSAANSRAVKLTFNVPQPCARPASQPTGLTLTATSDNVAGSFEPCDGADNYLVVYCPEGSEAALPVDRTVYKAGESLGDATVAAFGPATSFNVSNLTGGTNYIYTVYAVNAFGIDGPVYNTTDPLIGSVSTLPAGAASVEFTAASLTSITLDVVSNEAGDDVVILYNSYVERVNTGDHGYFGAVPAEPNVGDKLPVPDDFTPYWNYEGAPMPSDAGTVCYIGKAGTGIAIDNLEPGTGYYFVVYTRNAAGEYTTLPLYGGYSTYIENPYDGDSYNYPRFRLPNGWTGSESGATTVNFRDEEFVNRADLTPSRGTQLIQQRVNLSRGDAVNGKEAWMTPAPVYVNDRHCMVRFDYSMTTSPSRFETNPYNDWAEGDEFQIRLSEDNGVTWTAVASYTDAEHPAQAEVTSYVSIAADLNAYRGRTVMVQLYWKTFTAPTFGANLYVDRFSISQAEFPAVPEVTVNKITHQSAVVSWVSQQTDYQLLYFEKGSNVTHTVAVEGATSYTLSDLKPSTEYVVKVRGVLSSAEEAYSEWSDPVEFTTEGYPEVDAPADLVTDTETFASLGYVKLSWGPAEDALSYEVAYRMASSTEWIYINCDDRSTMLSDLIPGEQYIWKVRAFCTHDRRTPYSAQVRFEAPQTSALTDLGADGVAVEAGCGYVAVRGAEGQTVAVYTLSGSRAAFTASASADELYDNLPAGVYVVSVGGSTVKVAVK